MITSPADSPYTLRASTAPNANTAASPSRKIALASRNHTVCRESAYRPRSCRISTPYEAKKPTRADLSVGGISGTATSTGIDHTANQTAATTASTRNFKPPSAVTPNRPTSG